MAKPTKAVQAPAQPVIQVITGGNAPAANFRANSARAAWYAHLVAHNGQTPAAFCAAALANPPSTPKHGKLANTCEPPTGWLQYFTRNGYATIAKG